MCLAVASEAPSSSSSPLSSDAISTATRWLYMLGEKPVKVERGYGHGQFSFSPLLLFSSLELHPTRRLTFSSSLAFFK